MNHNLNLFTTSVITVSILTWTASIAVHARSRQLLLDHVYNVESPLGRATRSFYSYGPASMAHKDSISLSNCTLRFDHNSQSRPTMVQTGSGHTDYSLGVNSYYKLGSRSTVWGEAYYTKRLINNISFNDCLDYEFIAPYCMGDDTGGDISTQRYRFGGGWNGTFDKWMFGIEGNYRAEIGYRSHDPRVRDIVSDLDIAIGVSRRVNAEYHVAINLGVKVYNQDCDVEFLNEANSISTLVYSGMGEYFQRFTGNTVSATAYSGNTYKIGIDYIPAIDTDGLFSHLEAQISSCDMFLREHNNATGGYTSTYKAKAALSWIKKFGNSILLFPSINLSLSQRQGTENLFGSGMGIYDIIDSRKMYKHMLMGITLDIPVKWNIGNNLMCLTVTPSVSFYNNNQQLLDPARKLKATHLTAGLAVDAMKRLNRSFIHINLSGFHRNATKNITEWGGLDLTTPIGSAVKNNYDMLSSNATCLGASASYGMLIGGLVYELSLNYNHIKYSSLARGNAIMASLQVKF